MLAWREHRGPAPQGLGATPKLFDDGNWYVMQPIGGGASASWIDRGRGVGAPEARVLRYGLGSAADDLSAFNSSLAAGDTYLAAGEYGSAVTAYQAAGNAGVTVLGPEIDTQTGGLSKALTQQAWAINGNLAAVTGTDASAAQSAQGFARQMQNLYTQGIGLTPFSSSGAQPSAALLAAAQALVTRINQGCSQAALPEVSAFQTQYNTEGQVTLTVDGEYGPDTQAAVARVLGSAPNNCFGSASGGGGGSGVLQVPAITITPSPKTNWTPWIIGGAAAAGAGVIGYAVWKRNHRRR